MYVYTKEIKTEVMAFDNEKIFVTNCLKNVWCEVNIFQL